MNRCAYIFLTCLLLFTVGCCEQPQTAEQAPAKYVYTHVDVEYSNISQTRPDSHGLRYYTIQVDGWYLAIPSNRITIFIDNKDYISVYTKINNETGEKRYLPNEGRETYVHITEETLRKLKRYD